MTQWNVSKTKSAFVVQTVKLQQRSSNTVNKAVEGEGTIKDGVQEVGGWWVRVMVERGWGG